MSLTRNKCTLPKPMKPPLAATNSWIITRARELIGYDKYDTVEQWLDDVSDDGQVETNKSSDEDYEVELGNNTCKSPSLGCGLSRLGHPAGELEDYDPDCTPFSHRTTLEILEIADTLVEARKRGYSDGAFSGCGNGDDATELSLASSCYGYGYLPSDSGEGAPILESVHYQDIGDTDSQSTADVESKNEAGKMTDSPSSFRGSGDPPVPPSPPSASTTLDAVILGLSSGTDTDTSQPKSTVQGYNGLARPLDRDAPRPARPLSRIQTNSYSQFLTVPETVRIPPEFPRTQAEPQSRDKSRLARKYSSPKTRPKTHPHPHLGPQPGAPTYFFARPFKFPNPEIGLGIERGSSPFPRLRGAPPYAVSPDSETPPPTPTSVFSVVSSSSSSSSGSYVSALEAQIQSQTQTRSPELSVGVPIPGSEEVSAMPEVVRPVPHMLSVSSFPGIGHIHVAVLTVDEDGDKDESIETGVGNVSIGA